MSVKPGSPRPGEDTTDISNKIPSTVKEEGSGRAVSASDLSGGGFLNLILNLVQVERTRSSACLRNFDHLS